MHRIIGGPGGRRAALPGLLPVAAVLLAVAGAVAIAHVHDVMLTHEAINGALQLGVAV